MKAVVALAVLLMATSAWALTVEEETFVGQLYQNRDKLVELYQRSQELSDLADNLGTETIPLELEVLRAERQNIIDARDVEVDAVKAQALADIDVITSTYEVTIDSKESEISAKQAELDSLITP